MDDPKEKRAHELIRDLRWMISSCNAALASVKAWNDLHPDERPFSPDDDSLAFLKLRQSAQRIIECVERGEPIRQKDWDVVIAGGQEEA